MKYNKLVVGGCSFVYTVNDTEDLKRNVQPEYVKQIIKSNPNKNISELKKLVEQSDEFSSRFNRKWILLLKEYLGIELEDFSRSGKSNPQIFHDVINYLIENENETNNLVIIGTSALNRVYRWYELKEIYISLHLKPVDKVNLDNNYMAHVFDNKEDLSSYQELYLKYFYNSEEVLSEVQKNINLLKYICHKQNHKLLIFDNLIFSASRNSRILNNKKDNLKEKFRNDNNENLIYLKDDIFCFGEFIKSYDSKYSLTHPNTKDHEILFNIIKEKL